MWFFLATQYFIEHMVLQRFLPSWAQQKRTIKSEWMYFIYYLAGSFILIAEYLNNKY